MKIVSRVFLLTCAILLYGCGYALQGTKNPLQDFGIQKIYVAGFTNRSYRPGIEQMFMTAMIREIEKGGTFKLVGSRQVADAILTGEIISADFAVASTTALPSSNTSIQVGTEYVASVNCQITLEEQNKKVIFSQTFSGTKNYTGSYLSGTAGATVPTTNDSEQRLAYQYLSTDIMAGAYQRMIDLF